MATTTTAPDGSYIFDGLAPDDYVVVVNDGVTPAGYTQTGDPDGTLNNSTTVTLGVSEEYLEGDFGYNAVPASSSSNPAAVDNAAARPPAATSAMIQFGRLAISGFARTMMSRSTLTISFSKPS